MPSHKLQRNTEDIKRELTAVLRELKDPRVSGGLISIVRVEVTNDMSYCTVYVSAMEGLERAKTAVKGLESAAGYIRRELGARLHLRHVPQLLLGERPDRIQRAYVPRDARYQRRTARKRRIGRRPRRRRRTGGRRWKRHSVSWPAV